MVFPLHLQSIRAFGDADFKNFLNRSSDIVDKANGVHYIIDNEFLVVL